jgi:hypothetical protein
MGCRGLEEWRVLRSIFTGGTRIELKLRPIEKVDTILDVLAD